MKMIEKLRQKNKEKNRIREEYFQEVQTLLDDFNDLNKNEKFDAFLNICNIYQRQAEQRNIQALIREMNQTALHISVKLRDLEMASILLQNNADPNSLDHFKKSPLYIAIEQRDLEMTKLLFFYGACPVGIKNQKSIVNLQMEPEIYKFYKLAMAINLLGTVFKLNKQILNVFLLYEAPDILPQKRAQKIKDILKKQKQGLQFCLNYDRNPDKGKNDDINNTKNINNINQVDNSNEF
ncbi:Ankyrin repeat-containing domain [Pseudocohnilembus persalinus]|uniref:Ankyrin repeat-containing domain n=1 Tax=Pseudocohnilembus persalinus TaxID=266149 RepID=A0A0V0QNP4_PSEPJ|nr:Ankyrin repeat-containing domain [Pseudocohnilembus persalinus]|eukprot:KRX03977.1 Ankyrin repeat-containing domain [Pseudocohnilembus persalinus]